MTSTGWKARTDRNLSDRLDRPLTNEEQALIRWMLEHGCRDNAAFLAQLDRARVAKPCDCGCASIDLSIDRWCAPCFGLDILSDYQWSDDAGHLFGAFVFAKGGLLAGLDLWVIDAPDVPTALPPIERLRPLQATRLPATASSASASRSGRTPYRPD